MEERPPRRHGLGRVTVFGGGIAGLTAAHELAERGFEVVLVEPELELDASGDRERIALGGIARTQYALVPADPRRWDSRRRRPKGSHDDAPGPAYLQRAFKRARPHTRREQVRLVVRFGAGDATVTAAAREALTADVDRHQLAPRVKAAAPVGADVPNEEWGVRVRAYGDAAGTEHEAQALAERRLTAVVAELAALGVDGPRVRACTARPRLDPRVAGPGGLGCVIVELHAAVVAGEHGFRFFPGYYHHLRDTLRRIPLLDRDEEETGRTVHDLLVSTRVQGIVGRRVGMLLVPRTPVRSWLALLASAEGVRRLGYTFTDIQAFTLRLLRFMATSPARRRAELEDISWWDYLRGMNKAGDPLRYRFSETFERDFVAMPRILAAFDARDGDARSAGATFVQMADVSLRARDHTDALLEGPTSEAWFRHWRRYLRTLGVRFRAGRLERLEHLPDQRKGTLAVRAWVSDPQAPDRGTQAWTEPSDYLVVATDAVAAERVTQDLPPVGVVAGLRGFTTRARDRQGAEGERDPERAPDLSPQDRFRTLSGVQFYFSQNVKLFRGHLYFLDAKWSLTSVGQQQFWRRRPKLARDGFAGVLSVDVGDWRLPADGSRVAGRHAWDCDEAEVAREVYRQLHVDLTGREPDAPVPPGAPCPPPPDWFHIDRYLEFAPSGDGHRVGVVRNRAPYLVPLKGDWRRRPGADPWDPAAAPAADLPPGLRRAYAARLRDANRAAEGAEEGARRGPAEVWIAGHGGYQVHFGGLVFAGTYLRHFTRMTTMECANESARHAVNAVLDHWLAHRSPGGTALGDAAVRGGTAGPPQAPETPLYANLNTVFEGDEAEPAYLPTPAGDYCQIWNPEENEPEYLAPLRHLDEQLVARGLPHLFDLLGVEVGPMLASRSPILGRLPFVPAGPSATLRSTLRALVGSPLSPLRLRFTGAEIDRALEAIERFFADLESAASPGSPEGEDRFPGAFDAADEVLRSRGSPPGKGPDR